MSSLPIVDVGKIVGSGETIDRASCMNPTIEQNQTLGYLHLVSDVVREYETQRVSPEVTD